MDSYVISSPLGWLQLKGNAEGLASLKVWDSEPQQTAELPATLLEAVNQLNSYFRKDLKSFDLKLNPCGTPFEKRVWHALTTIPYGKTVSYIELAKQLSAPKAVRAVAQANGKNPLWIIIPCHRVIGSDGSLTGYAGGLHRKRWLLDHENQYRQQVLF